MRGVKAPLRHRALPSLSIAENAICDCMKGLAMLMLLAPLSSAADGRRADAGG